MCFSAPSRPRTCRRSSRLARPVRVDPCRHSGDGEGQPTDSRRRTALVFPPVQIGSKCLSIVSRTMYNVFCINGRHLDRLISVSRPFEDFTSALRDLRPTMSKDTTFYRIDMGDHRLVASSSIDGLQGLLIGEVPGRYVIEEVTSPPGFLSTPKSRRWGWAIKCHRRYSSCGLAHDRLPRRRLRRA